MDGEKNNIINPENVFLCFWGCGCHDNRNASAHGAAVKLRRGTLVWAHAPRWIVWQAPDLLGLLHFHLQAYLAKFWWCRPVRGGLSLQRRAHAGPNLTSAHRSCRAGFLQGLQPFSPRIPSRLVCPINLPSSQTARRLWGPLSPRHWRWSPREPACTCRQVRELSSHAAAHLFVGITDFQPSLQKTCVATLDSLPVAWLTIMVLTWSKCSWEHGKKRQRN